MLPDCATASRMCRSLSLIRRPIRSFQRMGHPLAKLLTRCTRIVLFSYIESGHAASIDESGSRISDGEATMIPIRSTHFAPVLLAIAIFGSGSWPVGAVAQSYPNRLVKVITD